MVHVIALAYGWTKDYILSDMTIPEMVEYSNRIMLDKNVDKIDFLKAVTSPHQKKSEQGKYGKELMKRASIFSNKLKSHRQEPMQKDEVERLVRFLGGGNKLKKK